MTFLLNVVLAIPTWIAPLLFLVPAEAQLRAGPRRLWIAWGSATAILALLSAVNWFISPDHSGYPFAAMASQVVLVGPALAVTGAILRVTAGSSLTRPQRFAMAAVLGSATLLVFLMPAALVSGALGGHEWGSPC